MDISGLGVEMVGNCEFLGRGDIADQPLNSALASEDRIKNKIMLT